MCPPMASPTWWWKATTALSLSIRAMATAHLYDSEGGTASPNALMGNGGHLAAIDPKTLNILTTTPIGLSVLTPQTGTLNYTLKGIYNIGPGRSSFALASFGSGDLAVDSAEGVAFIQGDTNGDGGFQTSNAYSALAPALGATMGQFRPLGNPLDVVVATAAANAVQGQLLTGDRTGAFTASTPPTNTSTGPSGIAPTSGRTFCRATSTATGSWTSPTR